MKKKAVESPAQSSGAEVTPIQLLAIVLKAALKDRITEEEVENICSVYYKTVKDWWGDEDNS
jgi:hypothetical protein